MAHKDHLIVSINSLCYDKDMDSTVQKKISQLESALADFKKSLDIDLDLFSDPVVLDTIKNGHIQKFEMSLELLWKTMKKYLFEMNGIDMMSPKTVLKSWFENKYCSYEDYETLIDLINKRNKLSHLYNTSEYIKIHSSLTPAYHVMRQQFEAMKE
jgi:nucleotidyltransferase substrate binding protein (TIGR01987 family)